MIRRSIGCLLAIWIGLFSEGQQQIRITISSLPGNTPGASELYVAGDFNGWNPENQNFRFEKSGNRFVVELSLNSGKYEYKITRGSWDRVECSPSGKAIMNRELLVNGDTSIDISVAGWSDLVKPEPRKSTANPRVHILDTAFLIPQLGRYRRVWIYLPVSYTRSGKRYPVLYMQDGQNVFDDATSFAGEWGVDEAIDTLGAQYGESIVVAIDHGASKRLNEYCPYDFSLPGYQEGKGEGKLYVDFIAHDLKTFIDRNYRTKPGRRHTFIAGSSMGGLISFYAVLQYPRVFGGAGVFSPAFQVSPPIFDDIRSKGKKIKAKIYFYAGDTEGESMETLTRKAFEEVNEDSGARTAIVIRKGGKHSESWWRREFPQFYKWIRQ